MTVFGLTDFEWGMLANDAYRRYEFRGTNPEPGYDTNLTQSENYRRYIGSEIDINDDPNITKTQWMPTVPNGWSEYVTTDVSGEKRILNLEEDIFRGLRESGDHTGYDFSGSTVDAFSARVYANAGTNEVIVSFRGSESFEEIFGLFDADQVDAFKDWWGNLGVNLRNIVHEEVNAAYYFTQQLKSILDADNTFRDINDNPDYKLAFTGHSLGAYLATIIGAIEKASGGATVPTGTNAVVFNPVGAADSIAEIFTNGVSPVDDHVPGIAAIGINNLPPESETKIVYIENDMARRGSLWDDETQSQKAWGVESSIGDFEVDFLNQNISNNPNVSAINPFYSNGIGDKLFGDVWAGIGAGVFGTEKKEVDEFAVFSRAAHSIDNQLLLMASGGALNPIFSEVPSLFLSLATSAATFEADEESIFNEYSNGFVIRSLQNELVKSELQSTIEGSLLDKFVGDAQLIADTDLTAVIPYADRQSYYKVQEGLSQLLVESMRDYIADYNDLSTPTGSYTSIFSNGNNSDYITVDVSLKDYIGEERIVDSLKFISDFPVSNAHLPSNQNLYKLKSDDVTFSNIIVVNQGATGSAETISVSTSSDNDLVIGLSNNEIITDDAGDDAYFGGLGDDTVIGGIGNDFIHGGWGYSFSNPHDAVNDGLDVVDYSTLSGYSIRIDTPISHTTTVPLGETSASGTENVVTRYYEVKLINETTSATDYNQTLVFVDHIIGTNNQDYMEGNANLNDYFSGAGDNDTLIGIDGNDTLEGGAGDDRLEGGADVDTYMFNDGEGSDRIIDTDKDGILILDGVQVGTKEYSINGVSKATQASGANSFELKHNGVTYNLSYDLKNGGDLVLARSGGSGSLTIEDFENGGFGIGLSKDVIKVTETPYPVYERDPNVVTFDNGDYMIVWVENSYSSGTQILRGQKYNSDGVEQGSELLLDQNINSNEYVTETASFSDGSFVVTWIDNSNSVSNVKSQRYDESGVKLGSQSSVTLPYAAQSSSGLDVKTFSDGSYFLALGTSGQDDYLWGQKYHASGVTDGSLTQIETTENESKDLRSGGVVALADNKYVVISNKDTSTDSSRYEGEDVLARIYNANGTIHTNEILVTSEIGALSYKSSIALANTNFLVSWKVPDFNAVTQKVYGKLYDINGNAIGDSFLIADQDTYYRHFLAPLSDGGFYVVYSQSQIGTVAQKFNSDGTANGSILQVNDTLFQIYDVQSVENGKIAITYQDGADIVAQIVEDNIFYPEYLKNNSINGGSAPDTLNGGGGNDTINAEDNDDVLDGGRGNDRLNGGGGHNTITGGSGVDFVDYSDVDDTTVDVNLEDGTTYLGDDTTGPTDILYEIEGVIGTSGDDSLVGNGLANHFIGNGGHDTLAGGLGYDTAIVLGQVDDYGASFVAHMYSRDGEWVSNDGTQSVDISNVERLIFNDADLLWTGTRWINSHNPHYLPIEYFANILGAGYAEQNTKQYTGQSNSGSGQEGGVRDVVVQGENIVTKYDPLVIDKDGDGIELLNVSEHDIFFDMDNDGLAEKTGWVSGDDALLAVDINNNGIIDNITELFGDADTEGFAELATFDSNGDGLIDAQDANFSNILVWQDANENGVTDAGELTTLSANSITALAVGYTETSRFEEGNQIIGEGHYVINGSSQALAEVLFLQETESSIPADNSIEIDAETLSFAFSLGYGDLHYLQAAMSENPYLFSLMEELESLTPEQFDVVSDKVRAFLFEWAGATDVDPATRGAEVDGREIAFLEKFMGRPILGGGDTDSFNAAIFNRAFDLALEVFETRFVVQGVMNELFPDAVYNFETGDAFIGSNLTAIQNAALNSTAEGEAYWIKWATILDRYKADVNATDAEIKTAITTVIQAKLGIDVSDTDSFAFFSADADVVAIDAENNLIFGGDGDDSIVAHEGDDIISGGAGNDTIQGSGSFSTYETDNDTYLFGVGDGQDKILDVYGTNVIRFKEGITFSDIRLEADGADLMIYIQQAGVDTGDSIRISMQLWGTETAPISELQFADNSVYDLTQNLSFSILGTVNGEQLSGGNDGDRIMGLGGNDTLQGQDGNDTLHGGIGNDLLNGGNGSDTFLFGYGDGQDKITDTSRDNIIEFGAGITAADLRMTINTISYWKDLYINLQQNGVDTGDVLHLEKQDVNDSYNTPTDNVVELRFEDGSVVSLADNLTLRGDASSGTFYGTDGNDIIDGGAGNDNVIAWGGDDTVLGGAGNDTLNGHNGIDTYVFGYGDGQDTISDSNAGNYLQFEAGITLDDVRMVTTSSATNHDLYIYLQQNGVDTGDMIYMSQVDRIAEFRFGDGTVLSSSTGLYFRGDANGGTFYGGAGNDTIDAGAGNDNIIGWGGDDTIYGGLGDDTLNGHNGIDTYIFGFGDGSDYIDDTNMGNFLQFGEGITLDNLVTSVVDSYHLVFGLLDNSGVATGDQVKLNYQLYYYPDIAGFSFANGESLNVITYHSGGNMQGTAGKDYLLGSGGNNTLTGGADEDVLVGGAGADYFVFGAGDSTDAAQDVIRDFAQGQDHINVTALGITSLASVTINAANGSTYVDDINSDFSVELKGIYTLTENDFIFAA